MAIFIAFGFPALFADDPRLTDEQATALTIFVFIFIAYLYHWGGCLWRWGQTHFKPKSKVKPKPARQSTFQARAKPMLSKPMTDIDRELEELKRKLEGK